MSLATITACIILAALQLLVLYAIASSTRRGRALNRRLASWIFTALFERIACWRKPDLIIGDARDPYMLRWWLLPKNPGFNAFLHCIMRSDDDRALHDHPWLSLSFMLQGEVIEHTIDAGGEPLQQLIEAGAWRFRTARMAHRLELPIDVAASGRQWPCWTLFFTGPRVREWGFHCPRGWISERQFSETIDGHSTIGRGCD